MSSIASGPSLASQAQNVNHKFQQRRQERMRGAGTHQILKRSFAFKPLREPAWKRAAGGATASVTPRQSIKTPARVLRDAMSSTSSAARRLSGGRRSTLSSRRIPPPPEKSIVRSGRRLSTAKGKERENDPPSVGRGLRVGTERYSSRSGLGSIEPPMTPLASPAALASARGALSGRGSVVTFGAINEMLESPQRSNDVPFLEDFEEEGDDQDSEPEVDDAGFAGDEGGDVDMHDVSAEHDSILPPPFPTRQPVPASVEASQHQGRAPSPPPAPTRGPQPANGSQPSGRAPSSSSSVPVKVKQSKRPPRAPILARVTNSNAKPAEKSPLRRVIDEAAMDAIMAQADKQPLPEEVRTAQRSIRPDGARTTDADVVWEVVESVLMDMGRAEEDRRIRQVLKAAIQNLELQFAEMSSLITERSSLIAQLRRARKNKKVLRADVLDLRRRRAEVLREEEKERERWRLDEGDRIEVQQLHDFFTELELASTEWSDQGSPPQRGTTQEGQLASQLALLASRFGPLPSVQESLNAARPDGRMPSSTAEETTTTTTTTTSTEFGFLSKLRAFNDAIERVERAVVEMG